MADQYPPWGGLGGRSLFGFPAAGVAGALVLAAINRRLNLNTLIGALRSTGRNDRGLTCKRLFVTPPFGFSLFYLRGVAPESVKTTDLYRGVVPFIIIQLTALILMIRFPQMVIWVMN